MPLVLVFEGLNFRFSCTGGPQPEEPKPKKLGPEKLSEIEDTGVEQAGFQEKGNWHIYTSWCVQVCIMYMLRMYTISPWINTLFV